MSEELDESLSIITELIYWWWMDWHGWAEDNEKPPDHIQAAINFIEKHTELKFSTDYGDWKYNAKM